MLHGRQSEQAAVAALIDEAWAGRGGALVLKGAPGVGKSALVADAAARAEGMTLLRTQGIESESPLPFAALQRLLRPVMRCVESLPEPQARALRAAFGEVDESASDRFLVFLAALSLLAEVSEQAPVLAVVDDAHWLDDASAAALLFVARRLQVERIAMLFATRVDEVRTFDSGDLPSVMLAGMDADAAGDLISGRAGVAPARGVVEALVTSTGGNPLALVELTEVLSRDQIAGSAPLPARLPLTEGVERAFLDRYRRLPADARTVLLVAAADDSGRVSSVRRAAGVLGAADEALEAAERSGLVRVSGSALELRHPLVRSAVYGAATSSERRRVHRAIASTLDAEQDSDRRAWHLAASVEEPDESVVRALDEAAERAVQRGGHEAAASAWERASELSTEPDMRARLLYLAARSAWLAAQSARARALVEAAAGSAREIGLRADILRLRARIEWNTGSVHVGHRIVLEAAVEAAPHDPQRAREMAMFAAALASFGARSGIGAKPTDLVPPPEPDSPARVRCFSDLLYGLDAFSRREWAAGAPFLRRAFALADELEPDDLDLLPNLGIAALHCGDDELTLRFHDALLVRARSTGAIVMILYSLTRRSLAEIATGRWNAAAASASEALPLAANSGQRGLAAFPTAVLALIAALRGDAGTERHLAEVERITGSQPLGILVDVVADVVRWARGVREWTDAPQAVHHFEQISHPISRRLAAIDRLDSARRAERLDLLREWTLELDQFAEATGASSTIAAAQHGHALLTDGPDAEKHFLRSLEEHSRTGRAPDRARTQLAYGEFLRRSRRRVDARTHLREALDAFDDLGAVQWAERARQELRASGETARRRDVSTVTDLTPQEMNVARLVRQGLSNRDIAGQLFLSTRTIDFHLRNVFAKVGVSSRTELAALPLD